MNYFTWHDKNNDNSNDYPHFASLRQSLSETFSLQRFSSNNSSRRPSQEKKNSSANENLNNHGGGGADDDDGHFFHHSHDQRNHLLLQLMKMEKKLNKVIMSNKQKHQQQKQSQLPQESVASHHCFSLFRISLDFAFLASELHQQVGKLLFYYFPDDKDNNDQALHQELLGEKSEEQQTHDPFISQLRRSLEKLNHSIIMIAIHLSLFEISPSVESHGTTTPLSSSNPIFETTSSKWHLDLDKVDLVSSNQTMNHIIPALDTCIVEIKSLLELLIIKNPISTPSIPSSSSSHCTPAQDGLFNNDVDLPFDQRVCSVFLMFLGFFNTQITILIDEYQKLKLSTTPIPSQNHEKLMPELRKKDSLQSQDGESNVNPLKVLDQHDEHSQMDSSAKTDKPNEKEISIDLLSHLNQLGMSFEKSKPDIMNLIQGLPDEDDEKYVLNMLVAECTKLWREMDPQLVFVHQTDYQGPNESVHKDSVKAELFVKKMVQLKNLIDMKAKEIILSSKLKREKVKDK